MFFRGAYVLVDYRVNHIVNNLVRTTVRSLIRMWADFRSEMGGGNVVSTDPASQLASILRNDLRRGEYHPRERLVESDLVARYGFPRATVRSALVLLAADGLIDRAPNRGASVRSLSIDEGIELAEVRRELEAICARDAAVRATPDERRRLSDALEAMRYAVSLQDVHTYRQSSIGFHESVIDLSRHEGARRQLAQIRLHNLQRHFPAAFEGDTFADSVEDHIAVGEAIISQDAEGAESAMRAHVDRIVRFLTEYRATVDSGVAQ
jgi:DNA-binding GntR family transcriptional regulator